MDPGLARFFGGIPTVSQPFLRRPLTTPRRCAAGGIWLQRRPPGHGSVQRGGSARQVAEKGPSSGLWSLVGILGWAILVACARSVVTFLANPTQEVRLVCGMWFIPAFKGLHPSQLVHDFVHLGGVPQFMFCLGDDLGWFCLRVPFPAWHKGEEPSQKENQYVGPKYSQVGTSQRGLLKEPQ